MADYKYLHYLARSTDPKFDPAHPPGAMTPHSGIYKCQGCGGEAVCNTGDPLPTEIHHQHAPNHGAIGWRLIVGIASGVAAT
jgi:hypothetical protein